MKKGYVLGLGAVVLLAIALVLLQLIGASPETASAARSANAEASTSSSASAGPAASSAAAAPTLGGERATGASSERVDSDDPQPMAIVPIKKAYIQRENDSGPRGKDAPPPLFRKDTLQAMRAAVGPEVKRCIDESFQRNPDMKLEDNAAVAIIYTARAAQTNVSITKGDAVVHGVQDDDLLRCVETAAAKVQFRGAADQLDGEGRVQLLFDYKR